MEKVVMQMLNAALESVSVASASDLNLLSFYYTSSFDDIGGHKVVRLYA
jgi:hypothetical protein